MKHKTDKEKEMEEKNKTSPDSMDSKPSQEASVTPEGPEKKGSEEKKGSDEVILHRRDYEDLMARVQELEGLKDKLLRSAADFENAKKRLARERDEFIKFGQENLIRELLAAIDNFSRALAHARDSAAGNQGGVVDGFQIVLKQMLDILAARGLKRLEAVGKKFDPHFHEAVAYVEETGEDDIILDEVEPGYLLHDRLLRAAKVRVRVVPSPEKGKDQGSAPKEEKS